MGSEKHTPWKLRVSPNTRHMGGRLQLWHTKRGRVASFTSGGDEFSAEDVLAKLDAFHSEDGRTLENIPVGVFWRLYDGLKKVAHSDDDGASDQEAPEMWLYCRDTARALLDSLQIRESE